MHDLLHRFSRSLLSRIGTRISRIHGRLDRTARPYADPELSPTRHPAEIDRTMLAQVAAKLQQIKPRDEDIVLFLGEYLSEPKANVFFEASPKRMPLARFADAAIKRGLRLSSKTRMLYRGKYLFVNGESFVLRTADKNTLITLANQRQIDGNELAGASADVVETLHAWYEDGRISLR